MTPGDYERRGDGGNEGDCAGCSLPVQPNEPSVVRYSLAFGESGGIFHAACEPRGPQWYSLDDATEAPDV